MIRSRDFRHPVATEEQRVLTLTRKRADEAFSQRVVDSVTSVIQVDKRCFQKVWDNTRLLPSAYPERMFTREHRTQFTVQPSNKVFLLKLLTTFTNLFRRQFTLFIPTFQAIKLHHATKDVSHILVITLFQDIFELGTRMNYIAKILRIHQLSINIHIIQLD